MPRFSTDVAFTPKEGMSNVEHELSRNLLIMPLGMYVMVTGPIKSTSQMTGFKISDLSANQNLEPLWIAEVIHIQSTVYFSE